MTQVTIEGAVGKLEAEFYKSAAESKAVYGLLCHPHPLYGGSMHDRVIGFVDNALREQGFGSLKFNFRGVGDSVGAHDKGIGEVDDVAAVASWLRDNADVDQLVLIGYSFGAIVTLNAHTQVDCDQLILLAPPVLMMPTLGSFSKPCLAILGGSDLIVEPIETITWLEAAGGSCEIITDADHFFANSCDEMGSLISTFIKAASDN